MSQSHAYATEALSNEVPSHTSSSNPTTEAEASLDLLRQLMMVSAEQDTSKGLAVRIPQVSADVLGLGEVNELDRGLINIFGPRGFDVTLEEEFDPSIVSTFCLV